MKISAVRTLRLSGTLRTQGPFWEERLVRPIDIYPEYRNRSDFEGGVQVGPELLHVKQFYLRIEADDGPHGIAGPLPEMVAAYCAHRLRRSCSAPIRSRTRRRGTRCTGSWCMAGRARR